MEVGMVKHMVLIDGDSVMEHGSFFPERLEWDGSAGAYIDECGNEWHLLARKTVLSEAKPEGALHDAPTRKHMTMPTADSVLDSREGRINAARELFSNLDGYQMESMVNPDGTSPVPWEPLEVRIWRDAADFEDETPYSRSGDAAHAEAETGKAADAPEAIPAGDFEQVAERGAESR
jgi:hypothetical protein